MHGSSVTASHYALDSHAARKREAGRVHLDGFISYPTASVYGALGRDSTPNVDNLLLPVPVSGSHIGFSTLRMEPCWMALGQAAGIAASLAIDRKVAVQDVDMSILQDLLIDQKATLIYFRDLRPENTGFHLAQYMGLRGYLPGWDADLQGTVDEKTLQDWVHYVGLSPELFPKNNPIGSIDRDL